MHRLLRSPVLWILAPTLLALLWWAAYAALRPIPTVADLPPAEAVVVERYRDLATYDRIRTSAGLGQGVALDRLGTQVNVPRLEGVDRSRPLHLIRMPAYGPLEVGLVVLPCADATSFRTAFDDLGAIDQGRVRHAQQLEVYGDRWLAMSLDRDVVRRLGEGGPACEERGEDVAYAVRVPALVAMALGQPAVAPWRRWLGELGVGVDRPTITGLSPDGMPIASFTGVERVKRIEDAWGIARAWLHLAEGDGPGRVEIELEARDPALAKRLREAQTGEGVVPPAPAEAAASLRVAPGAVAPLAHVAWSLGLAFPGQATGPWDGAPSAPRQGGVLVGWVPHTGGEGGAVISAQSAEDPELLLEQGPWTLAETSERRQANGLRLSAAGPGAVLALDRLAGHLSLDVGAPAQLRPPQAGVAAGEVLLARFVMTENEARRLLGEALHADGILGLLAGGPLEGSILARGPRLVVRVGPRKR